MSFVHLHVHSEYSLLDGFSNIKKLVRRAVEMDMPALALTDHGTMFGVMEFYNAATGAGIKPIIGVEAYLAARGMQARDPQLDKKSSHLLLLAENETGYRNLLQIASQAQLSGFYYYPRIDLDFLARHAEGLICTSGCMSAEIPRLIQQESLEAARKRLDWYYEVFGADNFFLELQQHDIPELERINKTLLDLGRRHQARFLATNDVHYVDPDDSRLQDILLAIQTGCVLSNPNRMRMSDKSFYLRSPQEMAAIFAEVPQAISNTLLVAERCSLDLGFKGYRLPPFEVPDGFTPETYLLRLCEDGLVRRFGERAGDSQLRERLDYEIRIIHQMGFDTYFLIVWDLCRYAREQGIWYNARGSAAGSIVAYTLFITNVDPVQHGLIFERFLNPGRISMPDIDLDFRDDRRAEMLEYTARKYGDDKVAQIITFGTLGARAAIRDVGRVMDIPLGEVDRAAKLIPNIPGKPVSIREALEEVAEFKQVYQSTDYFKELIETASQMEGVVRNAGTHAAGVIVADKPIVEYIPLHRPTSGAAEDSPIKIVTQFEMSHLEALGLLKVDFLGLATLTIMARACDLIKARHGLELNLENIPVDDPATYELLGRGDTAGVFQVEGSGMRRYLMQMKPDKVDHVIAMVALFRPGPMDFIPTYIRRMHGEEEINYLHPSLEPIFKETYGKAVYQEQLMFAVMNLAGYTAPEADDLRKAIAKKQKDKLLKHREKFIAGAVQHDIPEETASAIFDDWEEFARYGFNKAHAADYGVLAVQTAYLKAHYPAEYMTAVLSVNQGDTDKVALYAADCRRMGIEVASPDVNTSGWDFTIEDHPDGQAGIRFGLGAIKNVGHGPVAAILQARQEGGPFLDINDFAQRVDLRQVGKRALECLVKVGALDRFGPRPALLQALDRFVSASAAHFRAIEMGQMSLFGAHTGVSEVVQLPATYPDIPRRDQLNWERELIGLYVSDHPLSPVMDVLSEAVTHFSGQLSEAGLNERVRVAGVITRYRTHQTKTGKSMAFVTLEDLQGEIELVVFPRTWEQSSELVAIDRIVLAEGRVDTQASQAKVLVDRLTTDLKVTGVLKPVVATRPAIVRNGFNPPHYFAEPVPDAETFPGDEEDLSGDPADNGNGRAQPPAISTEEELLPGEAGGPPAGLLPAEDESLLDGYELAEVWLDELVEDWEEKAPPPPDLFPPDWELASAVFDAVAHPADAIALANPSPEVEAKLAAVTAAPESDLAFPLSAEPQAADVQVEPALPVTRPEEQLAAPLPAGEPAAPEAPLPPYILSPIPSAAGEDLHMITIILRPSDDKIRDNLRIRALYGTLITYPGRDRFAFQVYEHGRGYLIEFPNFTTGLSQELINRLRLFISPENLRIEPITIQ